MPYTAEISRTNPACFVFLVDQSSSMRQPFGAQAGKSKADGVADAINRLIQNLAIKAAKSEGIRDYFHVGVIGYGSQVQSALGGTLAGEALVPISELADHPLRVEQRTRRVDDGAGGLIEQSFKFPVWFEPIAAGRTPMCEAFGLARHFVDAFLGHCPGCYPPLIVNITDGMATDGNPLQPARDLQKLASTDGNVLLFNAHLSSAQSYPLEFPSKEETLPDNFARLLFRMSSRLPDKLLASAKADGFPVVAGARGFVFNADLVSVVRFLDIGTRVAQAVR